uniref:Putative serpin n=1 Tax=Lutzomyia longipalpis TaxID=7200 RepID=A0A1B0GK26_LUTLO
MSVIRGLLVIFLAHSLAPRYSYCVLESSVLLAQDQMVDLTNQLGFRILYYHSLANRNNVALSPCGLASVLIALFEGSDGHSALEIRDTLELPWERDIIRVGFRDIHRRLRSYFYNQENLLSGLSLSKENVTIRPEYETLLRFYGYDLMSGGMMHTTTTEATTEETSVADTMATTPIATTTTTTEASTEATTTEVTTIETSTAQEISETSTLATTEALETTPTTEKTTTEELESTETTTIGITRTTKYIFTFTPPTSVVDEEETTSEISTISTTSEMSTSTEGRDTEETTTTGGNLVQETTTDIALGRRRRRKPKRQSRLINFIRRRRSPIEFVIPEIDTPPPFLHYNAIATPNPQYEIHPYQLTEDSREEVDLFYLNRFESAQVPYKFFNTIMKFAYLDSIQSSVLEVELDSDNYNLLLILPDYYYGLDRVLAAMKTRFVPNIRELRTEILQPTWIKAMIPKFFLHGRIVLTNDLQNMGILDIFEPTRANFSPMSDDEGIYTRHVEQAITVNIRIHANDNLKRYSSYYKTPVELAINRPFLFVVADKENHLAIIVGTVLNPLNSRIQ